MLVGSTESQNFDSTGILMINFGFLYEVSNKNFFVNK